MKIAERQQLWKPLFHSFFLCLTIGFTMLLAIEAAADLIIFHNGDFRYGTVKKVGDTYVLTVNGITKVYDKIQVRDVAFGVNKPAAGQVVTATNFLHAATNTIWSITGAVTHRSELSGGEDRKVILDVEDGYEISQIAITRANYSFYNQQGSYMTAHIVNTTTKTEKALAFRAFFYTDRDVLMSTKDLYIRNLPGNSGTRKVGRRFSLAMPDLPFDRIRKVRIVRKF